MKEKESQQKNFKSKSIIIAVLIAITIIILCLFMFKQFNKQYTIMFVTNCNATVDPIVVKENSTIAKPENPIRDGYEFMGWYYNNKLFDFSNVITENIELEAKWAASVTKNQGINLEKEEVALYIGDSYRLIATITLEKLKQEDLIWKSSAPNIVSVDTDGNIKALKEGRATISVTTENGEHTAKATVIVNKEVINETIKPKKYEITFKDFNGTTLANTQKVDEGTTAVEPKEPTKEGYTFRGWYNGETLYTFKEAVKENLELVAKWTKNECTITFINFDGRILETKILKYGEIITYNGQTPTKLPDNTYTYSFKGWNKQLSTAIDDTIFTATYNRTYIDYTITFLDEYGKLLSKNIYHYGDKLEPAIPTKTGNAQYSYIFAGWQPNLTSVEKDATYTATYTQIVNTYEITFLDEDGTTLSNKQNIKYGSKVTEPEEPTKEGHTFQGWYNGETLYTFAEEVTENVELVAKWTKNEYTITFINYDGTKLESKKIEYGELPEYTGETPEKPSDNTYKYEFAGWGPTLTQVKEDTTYTAMFYPIYIEYTITFLNEDGTELSKKTYHYGDEVEEPVATKPADAQYTYTFKGWEPAVTIVEKDSTYTATYESTINIYEVTFVDDDGSTLSNIQTVRYGNKATEPKDPKKEGHTFQGWYNGENLYTFDEVVTGNVQLVAKWTKNKYTITFLNYDGTLLETKTLEYDTVPTYTGEGPSKQSNKKYQYIFTGWTPNVTPVKKDTTYTATFKEKYIDYTIIFINDDETELSRKTYHYGDEVEEPEAPTKPASAQYTYKFSGWTPNVTTVEKDMTYKATYTSTVNSYQVKFINYDGTLLETQTLEYGKVPTYTGETPTKLKDKTYTYLFKGWDKELSTVIRDTTYTATFSETYIEYTIVFVNEDGTELSKKTYHYGDEVEKPKAPTKPANAQYTYIFIGWIPNVTTVEKDTTYVANYKTSVNKYKVTFVNYDGTILETKTLEYGKTPIYTGGTPTKPSDNTYTYSFKGWDKDITEVTEDVTYVATFDQEYINYTITFVNEDGTELSKKNYHYGDKVEEPQTPIKPGNAQYTYTFAGWTPTVTTVQKDTTYKATYESIVNTYKVTFENYDGTILETKTLEYGKVPTYTGETPTKQADNTYTYSFKGWDKDIIEVTEDATYMATFDQEYINYTITFVNEDGTELSKKTYHYGDKVEEPESPTKQANAQYTYTFAGWTPSITTVQKDTIYTATYASTVNSYKVTFKNYDGKTLESKTLEYGKIPTYTGETPTKPSDNTYTYSFKGWDKDIIEVTEDATYMATFDQEYINYIITFVNEDGTELSKKTYHYGDKVEKPKAPTKPGNAQYTYIFVGWIPNVTTVQSDATYTASYKTSVNKYKVTFVNYDGTILDTKTLEYGKIPTYAGETPTKPSDNTYTYSFKGWDKDITEVTEDVTYVATFDQEYINYTITFVNEDGTELSNKTYHYGDEVEEPESPTKQANAQYTYTFAGWTPSITTVQKDTIYTATYTSIVNSYKVTFENYDGKTLESKTLEYGEMPTYTGETPTKPSDNTYTYSFKGWDKDITEVTEDVTYVATFNQVYIEYTIIFVNEDGTEISKKAYHYGDKVEEPKPPTKPADNTYIYTFASWTPNVTTVQKDATYKATYDKTYIEYTIIFINEDGTELSKNTYHYGDEVQQPTATKAADAQYTYTFVGWTPSVTKVEKDTTYKATYSKTLNKYQVIFVDANDSTLADAQTVEYGKKATRPENPTKEGYTFIGWYNGTTEYTFDEEVTGNIKLTAKWDKIKYTITFINYDGSTLQTSQVEHGTTPQYTEQMPIKPADSNNEYVFVGWNPTIQVAKENRTYTAIYKIFEDVDEDMEYVVNTSNASKFELSKEEEQIDVTFTSYTVTNSSGETTTYNPPYSFLGLFADVTSLLHSLSSNERYESVNLYYKKPEDSKGKTIDLKDYDLTDTSLGSWYGSGANDDIGDWIGYVAKGTASTTAAFGADSDDLVGKTIEVTVILKDDYALEDGTNTKVYYLNFK